MCVIFWASSCNRVNCAEMDENWYYLRIGTAINPRQSPPTWYNCCRSWRRRKAAYVDTSQHAVDSGGWLWRSCGCLRHGTSSRWRCRWPTGAVWCSSNAASLGTVPGGGHDGFVFEDDKGRAWTSSLGAACCRWCEWRDGAQWVNRLFVKHVIGLTFCSSVRYFSNHQSIWADNCYFA